jgi:hypothetical protein
MKLYLLTRRDHVYRFENRAMVVRAETRDGARLLARSYSLSDGGYEHTDVWSDPLASTCEAIPEWGEAKVIICDRAGDE